MGETSILSEILQNIGLPLITASWAVRCFFLRNDTTTIPYVRTAN